MTRPTVNSPAATPPAATPTAATHPAATPTAAIRSPVPRPEPPTFDVDALIGNPELKVIVTCGSGGVGKTTTAAALGLRAAEQGRRVVVLTIDPARRLAQSLGLTELDNTPRVVKGIADSDGALLAMMLDMKRTFDDVVAAHTTPEKAQLIYDNPFYQSLSASFAGTQEYMAMEKLSQLRKQLIDGGDWDLIIVDTPPSRSALDFLDAPQRLGRFLDGRMIRLLTAPARVGGRAYLKVVTASFAIFTRLLTKVLGHDLLGNVSSFVAALETMFGGFRERADQTYELLKAQGTAFVVVSSPEPDALREASFFVERLQAEGMPLAGIVLNRMRVAARGLTAAAAAAAADRLRAAAAAERVRAAAASEEPGGGTEEPEVALAIAALAVQSDLAEAERHDRAMIGRFAAAHPDVAQRRVPALATDVHDLATLRQVGAALAGDAGQVGAALAGEPPSGGR